jgi:hypothetical protein
VSADPTPVQIARRAARVRAGWSAAVRRSRLRVDWRASAWYVPLVDEGLVAAARVDSGR